MKICHAPMEIAGQVGLINRMLREDGLTSAAFNYFQTSFDYPGTYPTDSYDMQKVALAAIPHFDIFHFHNSGTFIGDFRDLEWIKKTGGKVIMHHRGTDVRTRVLAKNGADYENHYVNAESSLPDDMIHENLVTFSKYIDAAIVQDYELYKYVKPYYEKENVPIHVLPRLCMINDYKPSYPSITTTRPLVVHAPSQREFKGTEEVEKAVVELQQEIPFDFQLIENTTHKEATALYQNADIIVDQILCGMYGNLSVEAMALGKAVIAYIRPDLKETLPQTLPIQSANPDTIKEVLRGLLLDAHARHRLGVEGRNYVEAYHDAVTVTKKLKEIYQSL
ncbi:glycosyltransferase [Alkalicoccobacillus murimartini]|uniref:Glycosyltransferase involved in cell wall biosynthesis n=1 Tax=Alkalicoccobacillus murimartini TaxID=171685 RepID=A0ABT9YJ30_9BACI|nr:glycosyltransferase [Alkalicoccobacillus murimartini]MDQ0207863.1 glycosyltransferase involved in cell wall biosynthesis [Alkalicoccobacillus murimartini]